MVDMREDFERLREEDALLTPAFDSTVGAERLRAAPGAGGIVGWRTWSPRLAAGLAAAVIIVAAVWLSERTDADLDGAELAATLTTGPGVEWTSPTDFLLELPGAELLHAVPELGTLPTTRQTVPGPPGAGTDSARKGQEQS